MHEAGGAAADAAAAAAARLAVRDAANAARAAASLASRARERAADEARAAFDEREAAAWHAAAELDADLLVITPQACEELDPWTRRIAARAPCNLLVCGT